MKMIRIIGALLAVSLLAGCANLSRNIDIATGVYTFATKTTVPASVVVPVANSFNILKAGATNYGRYCIQQKMKPWACDATFRRNVIRAVRMGTDARNQMTGSLERGDPAAASVYNLLVSAVNQLKSSPAANAEFAGATP